MDWKSFFNNKRNRNEFILTVVLLAILMISFSQFLQFIEKRNGVSLPDPILNAFSPLNLTWLTFTLIYLSIVLFLFSLRKDPYKIMIALQAYGVMVIFRIIAMYLVPLEAPKTILLLNDPFVQLFGKGEILTKDLFFSGHTATLFLLFLLTKNKILKVIFLVSTVTVGITVLLQHVHYSIDVFVAPFVTYGAFRIITSLHIHYPGITNS
ncbi:MAG: sphingomyelin synthase family protein [Ignavibacteriaceae bacterium]|nr:sphingomyelin synthase family protein [Chlorobium sp.]MCW8961240.1 sphingomyelin synthase family protein [Ignavibacteriaceae bacterium]MCW9097842.1 sphingomyelin synthase family protein [Ignavibacteriaceae bacterium]